MRRSLTFVLRIAVVTAVAAFVRSVLAGRTAQRALHGTEPVVGSIDTWPTVPRRPTD